MLLLSDLHSAGDLTPLLRARICTVFVPQTQDRRYVADGVRKENEADRQRGNDFGELSAPASRVLSSLAHPTLLPLAQQRKTLPERSNEGATTPSLGVHHICSSLWCSVGVRAWPHSVKQQLCVHRSWSILAGSS